MVVNDYSVSVNTGFPDILPEILTLALPDDLELPLASHYVNMTVMQKQMGRSSTETG